MSPRIAGRLHLLGVLLHIPAGLAVTTSLVSLAAREGSIALPFFASAALSFAIGQALVRGFRRAEDVDLHDAMVVAALAWILVPFASAMALIWVGATEAERFPEVAVFAHPLNAYFEAISGFTSTGLSMSVRPAELPHSVQWWRSASQWVGGLGVIVLMLAIVRPGAVPLQLFRAEARNERALPSVKSTVRAYIGIYTGWTLVGIVLLWLTGAPAWQAVNHGLTAVATGGFTIVDRGSLGGVPTQLVLMGLMLVGALSFNVHAEVLRRRSLRALWSDGQHRLFWGLLAIGVLAVLLENRASRGEWPLVESAFQAVSALCTAGFQTASLADWSPGGQLLLAVAMVIGGAAGSTAGGIKMARAYLLIRGLAWRYREVLRRPHEVMRHDLDGRGVEAEQAIRAVESAAILGVTWVVFLMLGSWLLLHAVPSETGLGSVLLEVASAQGNVGLSSGITSPELPAGGKLVLMFLMWIGRLEILPVLVLLYPRRR